MLEPLFGNATAEKVLFYVLAHREAYARELAQAFELPVSVVQKQLGRLERGRVLASQTKGRTRLFAFDPAYPFLAELKALLARAMTFLPARERARYAPKRARPRETGKPL